MQMWYEETQREFCLLLYQRSVFFPLHFRIISRDFTSSCNINLNVNFAERASTFIVHIPYRSGTEFFLRIYVSVALRVYQFSLKVDKYWIRPSRPHARRNYRTAFSLSAPRGTKILSPVETAIIVNDAWDLLSRWRMTLYLSYKIPTVRDSNISTGSYLSEIKWGINKRAALITTPKNQVEFQRSSQYLQYISNYTDTK